MRVFDGDEKTKGFQSRHGGPQREALRGRRPWPNYAVSFVLLVLLLGLSVPRSVPSEQVGLSHHPFGVARPGHGVVGLRRCDSPLRQAPTPEPTSEEWL